MIFSPKLLESIPTNSDDNFKRKAQIESYQNKEESCLAEKIWNHSFLSTLMNIALACIPVLHAASPKDNIPKKPTLMKYKDLPIDECDDFYKRNRLINRHFADVEVCPEAKPKLLQNYLCPIVHNCRKAFAGSFFGLTNELIDMKNEACEATCANVRRFKEYMRHPDNLIVRSAVLVLSTVTGTYIGCGTRGITRKLFCGTLGALASGALCFPKETDAAVRYASFEVAKTAVLIYNSICGKKFRLRERLPCLDDLPPEIKPKK